MSWTRSLALLLVVTVAQAGALERSTMAQGAAPLLSPAPATAQAIADAARAG